MGCNLVGNSSGHALSSRVSFALITRHSSFLSSIKSRPHQPLPNLPAHIPSIIPDQAATLLAAHLSKTNRIIMLHILVGTAVMMIIIKKLFPGPQIQSLQIEQLKAEINEMKVLALHLQKSMAVLAEQGGQ
ncbi:hypothetical protein PGTUg99_033683 [Puccinia graminis f. sp. tritici]|uniref:Uncharacterized protein n=2 Tax=Puccinia graminis f. sp. tritici TaxID=56615 RepID=A0A5B0Q886_PUCGR|nr:hypothetical protein PGTUg99_033683 [Puccinia graminis f. sp. tritici]